MTIPDNYRIQLSAKCIRKITTQNINNDGSISQDVTCVFAFSGAGLFGRSPEIVFDDWPYGYLYEVGKEYDVSIFQSAPSG